MADIWFSGDHHFGHANCLKYDGRPWDTIEEHDEALIERAREYVRPNDLFVILGDMAWRNTKVYAERLPGRKILVVGNHDRIRDQDHTVFERIVGGKNSPGIYEFTVGPFRLTCSHYPLVSWSARQYGAWHLHAHSHGRYMESPDVLRVDVGVPTWDFRPVNFEVIRKIMQDRKEAWRERILKGADSRYVVSQTIDTMASRHQGYTEQWLKEVAAEPGVHRDPYTRYNKPKKENTDATRRDDPDGGPEDLRGRIPEWDPS